MKSLTIMHGTLAYFDFSKDTEIIVDASPIGIAGILVQHIDGETDVLAYGSRSLTNVEQRYSQIEREALACTWGCEHFRQFALGAQFTLTTDHMPLLSLFGNPQAKLPMRIERWMLRLQPYEYTMKHTKGILNPADYLSRHPQNFEKQHSRHERIAEQYINFVVDTATPKAVPREEIIQETNNNLFYLKFVNSL